MLDVRRLTLLREVRLRGSISAAARTLSYTPSAVSQQLSLLEKETGVVLLERDGRGVRLTDAAEVLVGHTEAVLAALDQAETDLARSAGSIRGVLHLSAVITVARAVIARTLQVMGERYPDLRVHFHHYEPEVATINLAARRLDLVIADEYPGTPSALTDFHTELVSSDPISAYLPVGTRARRLEDLTHLPWVLEPDGTAAHSWARRVCHDVGFQPQVHHQSADLVFHLQLVEAGIAAAFLPGLVVGPERGDLEVAPLFPSDLARGIYAVCRTGSEDRPAIAACRAVLKEALHGRP